MNSIRVAIADNTKTIKLIIKESSQAKLIVFNIVIINNKIYI